MDNQQDNFWAKCWPNSGQSQRGKRGHGHFYGQQGSNWQSGRENKSNNTFATRVNTVVTKNKAKNLGKIICYNCNNKGNYRNACLDPPKAKN